MPSACTSKRIEHDISLHVNALLGIEKRPSMDASDTQSLYFFDRQMSCIAVASQGQVHTCD